MRCIGDYVCIYWIITIITGEILLMKLFLALFINTYINHLKDENKQTGINL